MNSATMVRRVLQAMILFAFCGATVAAQEPAEDTKAAFPDSNV